MTEGLLLLMALWIALGAWLLVFFYAPSRHLPMGRALWMIFWALALSYTFTVVTEGLFRWQPQDLTTIRWRAATFRSLFVVAVTWGLLALRRRR